LLQCAGGRLHLLRLKNTYALAVADHLSELHQARVEIVAAAKRLRPDGLVAGTSGNISVRAGELVAITPSGVDYDALTPESIPAIDLHGNRVLGDLLPSSEVPMHLAVYARTSARAVVHTHSPYATVLSTLIDELPPIHYLLAQFGGPVRVAPYATYGTEELASYMASGLAGRSGVILQNHGVITLGDTLSKAYERAVTLEWLSALYYRARLLGSPHLLDQTEIENVARKLASYGQRD